MSNELAIYQPHPMPAIADVMTTGKIMAQSGFFADSREAAQAIVKILAGAELGFGPVASMTGIYIVKGRITLSANLMAAAIKRSGRYTYRVTEISDDACEIQFYEGRQPIGTSRFTAADAERAKLATETWRAYPRNMLFARALSNGARWYCADVLGGPVYVEGEIPEAIDAETGEITEHRTGRIDQPPPMKQAQAVAAAFAGGNGHRDRRDDLYEADTDSLDDDAARKAFWGVAKAHGYERQSEVHRLFGLAETPGALKEFLQSEQRGWRWAQSELVRLDGLRPEPDADAAQPALDGMPAVERERPENAVGAH